MAAVVLNYRRAAETLDCLAALSSTRGVDLDLLVVDNASGDGSEDAIRKARPDVEVIQTGRNRGYAGGMNAGLRRVIESGRYEFVLLINSDTLVDPHGGEVGAVSRREPRLAALAARSITIPRRTGCGTREA
ncbi:MAG: glycosyltransferase [Ignavibacteriae bacterium]|nr:glycosyltransferase [Ignavibacteriota bacterium]